MMNLWRGSVMLATAVILPTISLGQAGLDVGHIGSGPTATTHISDGAPTRRGYTLTQLHTQVTTLADGTQIIVRAQTLMAQDLEGRTRTENSREVDGGMQLESIVINDPVSLEYIQLYPKQKIARIQHMATTAQQQPNAESVKEEESFLKALNASPPEQRFTRNPQETREDLGTQAIAGLLARGTRRTSVIATGVQGNDRPLRYVNDIWMADGLSVPLKIVSDDPRSGRTEDVVTQVSTSPPDPAVFRVPEDYKIFDIKQ